MAEELKTKADELLDLLKEKDLVGEVPEMSLSEAAKKLNLDEDTIERWIEILQEQNIVKVKYKLATPYVYLVESKNKKDKKQKSNDAVDYSDFMKNRLDELKHKDTENEYEAMKKAYASLVDNYKSLISVVIRKKKNLDPEKTKEIVTKLKEIKKSVVGLKGSIDIKDVSTARKKLDQLSGMLKEQITGLSEVLNDQEKQDLLTKNEKIGEGLAKLGQLEQVSQLINNANILVSKGDFDQAKGVYKKIKEREDELPKQYLKTKEELTKNMIDLNKKMAEGIAQKKTKEFQLDKIKIQNLLSELALLLKDQKLSESEQKYKEIVSIISRLPKGFLSDEIAIENNVSLLYNRLLELRKKSIRSKIVDNIQRLNQLIKEIKSNIKSRNYVKAFQLCNMSREALKQIPFSFQKDIYHLEREVDELEEKILPLMEKNNDKLVNESKERIEGEINQLKQLIRSKNATEATKLYAKINKEIDSFSSYSLEIKTQLQEGLLSLYGKLSLLIEKDKEGHFDDLSNRIKTMIKQVVVFLKHNKVKEAQQLYNNILLLYDQLPEGFLIKKTILRMEILSVYGQLAEYYNQIKEKMLTNAINFNINDQIKIPTK